MWIRITQALTIATIFLLFSVPGLSYTSGTNTTITQTNGCAQPINLENLPGDITEVLSLALTPNLFWDLDSGRGGGGAPSERKNICPTDAKKTCQAISTLSLALIVTLFKHYFLNDRAALATMASAVDYESHSKAGQRWHLPAHPPPLQPAMVWRLDLGSYAVGLRQIQCRYRLPCTLTGRSTLPLRRLAG